MTVLSAPRVMPTSVLQAFVKFCNSYAIPMNHHVLAVSQLGSVPVKTAGYLATSYKAYSLARKGVRMKLSVPTGELTLWHSTVFLNRHDPTYYSPLLIRQGVHKISYLFDDNLHIRPHLAKHIPPTWLPVYQSALSNYVLMPPNEWSPVLGSSATDVYQITQLLFVALCAIPHSGDL